MKLFVMDMEGEGTGLDLALRAKEANHEVRYWLPITRGGNRKPYGDGMVEKPTQWKPSMDWADLIVLTGNNKYAEELAEYFGKGYPIFGCNQKAAQLELDRGLGQEILKKHNIPTVPYVVVDSVEEGIKHILKTGKGYAMKPWGGDANSAMTCVAKTPNDGVFTLSKWQEDGSFKGQLMLQELCEGIEMGVSGMFGPGGWNTAIEESFEHKKFLTGDLGENTGEMGTVIRHVDKSKLFDLVLEPLTDYLHLVKYVGDCSVNCIITEDGSVKPLEFTMRLGWPDFTIRQEVFKGDPVGWMYDLLRGHDSLVVSPRVAVGVVMTHGDFPKCKDPPGTWCGWPIEGISMDNWKHLHFQQVCMDEVPRVNGKKLTQETMECTAGPYVMVVSGSAASVSGAIKSAYQTVGEIKWASNCMHRIDIGKKLKAQLPILQSNGFAKGMEW